MSPNTGGTGWRFCWSWLERHWVAGSEEAVGAGEVEGRMEAASSTRGEEAWMTYNDLCPVEDNKKREHFVASCPRNKEELLSSSISHSGIFPQLEEKVAEETGDPSGVNPRASAGEYDTLISSGMGRGVSRRCGRKEMKLRVFGLAWVLHPNGRRRVAGWHPVIPLTIRSPLKLVCFNPVRVLELVFFILVWVLVSSATRLLQPCLGPVLHGCRWGLYPVVSNSISSGSSWSGLLFFFHWCRMGPGYDMTLLGGIVGGRSCSSSAPGSSASSAFRRRDIC
ncbi:hypothetical protein EYF80_031491 [Liparis tanakae]|uniref:Uncharacterized protein n=1 Tax=Liparis tanakae TaxID=230148 RepID=A0A4Z2GXJ3_9TELE|nr:hypothetical protein EYF80_031491 [Liparis tanakae]